MPKICSVQTSVPEYKLSQTDAREYTRRFFTGKVSSLDRLLTVFDHAGIETRYFSVPPGWHEHHPTIEEKNKTYITAATDLCADASRRLMAQHNLGPHDIDYIIYINTTGLATPSIDARLINVLSLRHDIHRTPIWGLGCAGGAAGLSHAYHYAIGHPDHRILLVAAELCGLTFMPDDTSKSNIVATALFGEGAAAVLICGDAVDCDGLNIISTQSNFYPDSLDVMGWNIISQGMQVVFDRRIPDIVAQNSKEDLTAFLRQNSLTLEDIDQFLFHPGGIKVVEAYEQALQPKDGQMILVRETLRDFGNMSSVTVLFVLERYLSKFGVNREGYGLISALGPGFCSESLLVKL